MKIVKATSQNLVSRIGEERRVLLIVFAVEVLAAGHPLRVHSTGGITGHKRIVSLLCGVFNSMPAVFLERVHSVYIQVQEKKRSNSTYVVDV